MTPSVPNNEEVLFLQMEDSSPICGICQAPIRSREPYAALTSQRVFEEDEEGGKSIRVLAAFTISP